MPPHHQNVAFYLFLSRGSGMNINASIVDQRIAGILETHSAYLPDGDINKKKSAAFVILSMATVLDISTEDAAELLTDGGNDAGVDGIYIGDVDDWEFTVSLFQGKYKVNNLSGDANFPENDVKKAINTISALFDPSKEIQLNDKVKPKIEEIRSLIRDGYIPNVRMVLCNNGAKWTTSAQDWINQSGFSNDQVEWTHWNHDQIVSILQKKKAVDDSLRLHGKAVIEDFNFRRVLVGKVPVTEIAELFNRHDDLLLERNIRRYLGLHSNRVNLAIRETLTNPKRKLNFYFFNNGITMICRKFRHNALQGENYQVKLEGLQIINGGQTCKTIQQTLKDPNQASQYENVFVLIRIYELSEEDEKDKEFVNDITFATNSQNPVDLRDLHSNDEIQRKLEIGIADLGYTYKRQREEGFTGPSFVTSATVAEGVLSIWCRSPHQGKFRRREHFGVLYDSIFKKLNAAQALLAVLIFRFVENQRKRPEVDGLAEFIPYASHYIALVIGWSLLIKRNIQIEDVTHLNFKELSAEFDELKFNYYTDAIDLLNKALNKLYGDQKVSLQQLSATFRRGDLLDYLSKATQGK
jgi:hypothetical protein